MATNFVSSRGYTEIGGAPESSKQLQLSYSTLDKLLNLLLMHLECYSSILGWAKQFGEQCDWLPPSEPPQIRVEHWLEPMLWESSKLEPYRRRSDAKLSCLNHRNLETGCCVATKLFWRTISAPASNRKCAHDLPAVRIWLRSIEAEESSDGWLRRWPRPFVFSFKSIAFEAAASERVVIMNLRSSHEDNR